MKNIYQITTSENKMLKLAIDDSHPHFDYDLLKQKLKEELALKDLKKINPICLNYKYLVFAGYLNSSEGGIKDLVLTTDYKEDVDFLLSKKIFVESFSHGKFEIMDFDWFQVFDTSKNELITN